MVDPAHPARDVVVCPQCNHANASASEQCERCATPLPFDQTLTSDEGWSSSIDEASNHTRDRLAKDLTPGSMLGARYDILRVLGQGGMGTVYEARDRELDRIVALKVIRGDLTRSLEIFKRFKQELILARQITHRNVIRIFDLGQADGIRFITMEYIEGEDLQRILKRKKKLEPSEAAGIMAQVCRALEAAHGEGVIHRDLKPQNIMLDKNGRAYVMDFGVARSTLISGMTNTGAVVGTPDYMSPEQAKGLPLDARSDLFAVGIIFYETLCGDTPFQADTTMGKLWKRTSEPARPLREVDGDIPQELGEIVRRCLEIDPEKRFANASELLRQIEVWQGARSKPIPTTEPYVRYAKIAGLVLAALVATGLALTLRSHKAVSAHAPVNLLIADFDNKTGDAVFDETLEPMLSVALEGSPFISSYSRGQAKKIASRLQPNAVRMDASVAQLVAVREGVNVVVSGSIAQEGNGYRVSVATLDPTSGQRVAKDEQVYAPSKQAVLAATGNIADRIRKGLGDTTSEASGRSAAETYTAASLQAAHAYAVGQDLQQAGKWTEAIKAFREAIDLDPEMGRAYAGVAVMYANLGKRQDAEKNYQLAMTHIDRMTDREKYRTRSGYYLLMRNQTKAIDELTALVQRYPADTAGRANLALAYFFQRDMRGAVEEQQRALAITPHSVMQRSNLSLYALYAGDFQTATIHANQVLQENPTFETGLRTLALANLADGHIEEAKRDYSKLESMSSRGASMAITGLADVALYEGRLSDAAGLLNKAIASDTAIQDSESAANDQATLALTQVALNRLTDAALNAAKAAADSKDEGVLYRAAQAYLALGQESRALQLIAPLTTRLENEPQVYAKLIYGEAQLKKGNAREALKIFQEAQKLSDTWLGRMDLGRAYLDLGAFTEASSEFDVCLSRRGEATSVFLDDSPTYHLLPTVYYYQGRAREGLGSPGALESYKLFLAIKDKASQDPLVAEANKRLAAAGARTK
jgi:eukaryotic-like serine/threonine-protein kinase